MNRRSPLLFIPGPVNVDVDVLLESAKPIINHRGSDFHELFEEIQSKLKSVFKTKHEIVMFTASGTGAVEALASNFGPRRKALVINAGEFGGRLAEVFRIYGSNVVEIRAELGTAPNLENVVERIALERPEIVAFVYNDTSPGVRLSYVRELCKAAKDHNALVLVDAVSAAGGDELDIDAWGIDGLAAASQKCLAAPPGLSFVALSEEAKSKMVDNPPTAYFDLKRYLYFMERKETPYTPAVTLLYALNKALEKILKIGVDNWVEMHIKRATVLYSVLEELNLFPFVKEPFRSRTVLSFTVPNSISVQELRRELREKYSIEVAGGLGALSNRILRIGVMGMISYGELAALINALGIELKRKGVAVDIEKAFDKLEKLKGLSDFLHAGYKHGK